MLCDDVKLKLQDLHFPVNVEPDVEDFLDRLPEILIDGGNHYNLVVERFGKFSWGGGYALILVDRHARLENFVVKQIYPTAATSLIETLALIWINLKERRIL